MVTLKDFMNDQEWINSRVYGKRVDNISIDDLLGLTRAIIHEVVELEDELNWKWWGTEESLDIAKIREEYIDVFIFTLSLGMLLGLSDVDIRKEFLRKNIINIKRRIKIHDEEEKN